MLTAILAISFLPVPAWAQGSVEVRISGDPALPGPIESELRDIFGDTLSEVLLSGSIEELRQSPSTEVAGAIRTGINIVIEPKGYSVGELELDLESEPIKAEFLVHPVGWTATDPHAVTDLSIRLSGEGLEEFWQERLGARLAENEQAIKEAYSRNLAGLPAAALEPSWALDLVVPHLAESDPAAAIFPDFAIRHEVTLGSTAEVTLFLTPVGDLVELIRPRMYSRTLYNLILDRYRERLLAASRFIEGMPKPEIEAASEEIASKLKSALEEDELSKRLNAEVEIEVGVLQDSDDPVALLTVTVESLSYDMECETFVDFGNESRDSTEIEARLGVLFTRNVEAFVNFNYFTNDTTLRTDVALGVLPWRDAFVAVGYDTDRKAAKYFFSQTLSPGLRVRGEIFQQDDLNEFGMTYQFQQYISAGVYTNGNNEYWVRGILRL
jgi:hypothetical protein